MTMPTLMPPKGLILEFACRPGECQAVSTEAEAPEELQTDTIHIDPQ